MRTWPQLLPLTLVLPSLAFGQADPRDLTPILKEEILAPAVALRELREHIVARVAKPPAPASAAEWTGLSNTIRQRLLKDVVFHGWPKAWIEAAPRFEETGVVEGSGYRIRSGARGGPWLAGMTLEPADVYEAWCHQRGYVCFIQEIGGRPIRAGERFGAAYVIGFFDDLDEMHQVYDRYRGHRGLDVAGDERSATWAWRAEP